MDQGQEHREAHDRTIVCCHHRGMIRRERGLDGRGMGASGGRAS